MLPVAAGATTTEPDPPAEQLTVVVTEIEPFVIDDGGQADGFYVEIWDSVARDLGVDYEVVWVDTFGELLPALDEGRADVAIAPLAPTAARELDYDFSSAVIASGPQLGYHTRLETTGSVFTALLSGPVLRILLAAVIGLVVLAHLIWLVERPRPGREAREDGDFAGSYLHGIWDGFWWATVTVTTVGYGDKSPRSVPGRLVALLAMFLSLFLVGAFVTQVSDVLRGRRADVPVGSLAEAGDAPIGVVADSSFAAYVEAEGAIIEPFGSQEEVFQAAEDGRVDLVVSNPFALSTVGPRYGLAPTGSVFYEEFETFGLAQDSPWREPVNRSLADLQAAGEIGEIVDRWLG